MELQVDSGIYEFRRALRASITKSGEGNLMRISSVVLLVLSASSFGQTQAPKVAISTQLKQLGSVYVYSYSVSVLPTSSRSVWWLSADISEPEGGASVSNSGLTNGTGFLASVSQTVPSNPVSVPTVPVGLS